MKWIFLASLLVFIPVFTTLLRGDPRYRLYAAFLIGALPFFLAPNLNVAPYGWPAWPGPVKGIEVSLLDAVALAVLFSTHKVPIPFSLKVSFGIIVVALIVSSSSGYQLVPAIFFAWQLLRVALVFVAVARLCAAVPQAPIAVTMGLGVALIYEALLATYQHFTGDARPGGTLGHANFLGLASDFVVFPTLALLLAGRRVILPALVVAAGLVIAVVGGSRATLGLFAIGSLLTIILSLRHRRSPKKVAFVGAATVMLLIAAPAMLWGVSQRSSADKISSDKDRSAMKLAATMMITDHPLGVGADQYVIVANTGGYSARAGVPWNFADRSAPVHDAYYLVAAELGVLGLFGLLALLMSFVVTGLRSGSRLSGEENSELIPGLVAALILVAVHISFEWVFMTFVPQYLLAISAGTLVALVARSKVAVTRRSSPMRATIGVPAS